VIIVKIGGSLYASPHLKEWCEQLAEIHQQPIVIVPGGGPFTDQVRDADQKWKLSDAVAHNMAVMGMQQFGLLISSINNNIKPLETLNNIASENPVVWLPYKDVLADCGYPKNWQTTSDSLALWLACKLSADHLCLVKSAKVDNQSTEELASADIVDNYFSIAADNYSGSIHFYHASQATHFIKDLNNGKFN
jgi:aspartokinase-like uncharacterized kinase